MGRALVVWVAWVLVRINLHRHDVISLGASLDGMATQPADVAVDGQHFFSGTEVGSASVQSAVGRVTCHWHQPKEVSTG